MRPLRGVNTNKTFNSRYTVRMQEIHQCNLMSKENGSTVEFLWCTYIKDRRKTSKQQWIGREYFLVTSSVHA